MLRATRIQVKAATREVLRAHDGVEDSRFQNPIDRATNSQLPGAADTAEFLEAQDWAEWYGDDFDVIASGDVISMDPRVLDQLEV